MYKRQTSATAAGLFIRFSGTTGSESSSIRVLSQSIEAGTEAVSYTHLDVYKRQLHRGLAPERCAALYGDITHVTPPVPLINSYAIV